MTPSGPGKGMGKGMRREPEMSGDEGGMKAGGMKAGGVRGGAARRRGPVGPQGFDGGGLR